jgi:U4/U6.U5 tri-snRNP-associated protein 1
MAATLKMLSARGDLAPDEDGGDGAGVTIEYRDKTGRLLNPKEAFRQLSYRFHGQRPGKKKQEQLLRRIEETRQMQRMRVGDAALNGVARMKKEQASTGRSFIRL